MSYPQIKDVLIEKITQQGATIRAAIQRQKIAVTDFSFPVHCANGAPLQSLSFNPVFLVSRPSQ
jgi:hypothetical protein